MASATDDSVTYRAAGGVATIALSNERRRNSLGLETLRTLRGFITDAGVDPSIAVVVVSGEGPAFSAGHDLAEMRDRDHDYYTELFDECARLMLSIHDIGQPVIAKVDGVATAAGCQLVASCDLVVATDRSTFATPGVRIGLFCSTPMVALSRAVGRKRALEMLLTGEPIDAATAADWGLVNRVVAPEVLDSTIDDLVASLTRFSPHTIAIGKRAFYEQIELDEAGAYEHTRVVMAANAADEVAAEGVAAFLDKRDPVWPEPKNDR